ncbi:Baseplate J-like protein [compost metagenome]
MEVPGVTRAWPLPRWMGPGTFGLAFVRDGDPDLIPTPVQVSEVQAYLEQKRPVTSEVYVVAPEARPIDFSLHLVPDGNALRAAVTQALHGLIVDEGGPGETLRITHVRNTISNTPGETDHTLSLPAADVLLGANQVAVPGVITWL